jgi:hypothetical protein
MRCSPQTHLEALPLFLRRCPVSGPGCPVLPWRVCQTERKNGESSPCAPRAGGLGSIVPLGVCAVRPSGVGHGAIVPPTENGGRVTRPTRNARCWRPSPRHGDPNGRRSFRSPDAATGRVPVSAAIAQERRRSGRGAAGWARGARGGDHLPRGPHRMRRPLLRPRLGVRRRGGRSDLQRALRGRGVPVSCQQRRLLRWGVLPAKPRAVLLPCGLNLLPWRGVLRMLPSVIGLALCHV